MSTNPSGIYKFCRQNYLSHQVKYLAQHLFHPSTDGVIYIEPPAD